MILLEVRIPLSCEYVLLVDGAQSNNYIIQTTLAEKVLKCVELALVGRIDSRFRLAGHPRLMFNSSILMAFVSTYPPPTARPHSSSP